MKSLIERGDCPMRHENGNCTVAGGFWSMSRHEGIDGRFYAEVTTVYSGLAVIGAAIVRAIR